MMFRKVVLYTGADGCARFEEEEIPLSEGHPMSRLTAPLSAQAIQLRWSPIGFRSEFHCTERPQWVFVLTGEMEIGLQDGTVRLFGPGEHFYSADTLPVGASFDPRVHGHRSRQVGPAPLTTAFVRG